MSAVLSASSETGPLSDSDWSRGPWEASCRTRLVRQRGPTDCGVACLAMVAGIEYEAALATFTLLGLARKPRPLSSNFKQLCQALEERGIAARMTRWRGWSHISGVGVLKVKHQDRLDRQNWHWVVAEAHPEFDYLVRDPDSPLVAFGQAPLSVSYRHLGRMVPAGNWIMCSPQPSRTPAQLDLGFS